MAFSSEQSRIDERIAFNFLERKHSVLKNRKDVECMESTSVLYRSAVYIAIEKNMHLQNHHDGINSMDDKNFTKKRKLQFL